MPVIPTDPAIDSLTDVSVRETYELIHRSDSKRDRAEKANRKRFARLFEDPKAIEVTITLTDEVMRIRSMRSSTQIFRRAAKKASLRGFGALNAVGLHALSTVSRVSPAPVIKLVHQRIRFLTKDLILSAENSDLTEHLKSRERSGIALNINVLGEAVLGEREADARTNRVIEMIHRPDVNYISVKLSSVVSQIITIDRHDTLMRVNDRLRQLYREAELHHTFINLDMEEYRDLDLTVTAFKQVLSESEFAKVNAGIVLQAYLPESHSAFADLVAWSKARHLQSGASIKIRLVKGANLAMELAEAELHGWHAAPYTSKADVDASYARLIDTSLRLENADAVRIGIASHNLFHLTWALDVARTRGVLHQIDVEMLEGMGNAEALALTGSGQPVLLYAPVTRKDDFASAVAYLVRRLDENTSDENYLKAAFDIATDQNKFEQQRERFLASVRERHSISTLSLRHVAPKPVSSSGFENSPSADLTDPQLRDEITVAFDKVRGERNSQIPLMIDGHEIVTTDYEVGRDPSANAEAWYQYSVADKSQIDQALRVAKAAQDKWSNLSVEQRRQALFSAAEKMSERRVRTLAVMARDAGKTVDEGDPEVSEGIDFARFYATSAKDFGDSRPLGVVLVVPPWNFPYAIPAGGVCAALAAGNSVILKPAPETVATAWELVQQLWDGGIPRDVLQFVPTRDDENGRHLVTSPEVDGVILTGAFDTASLFTSWRPDINLLAETSGKNAIVVTACADIDVAVKDLVQSAFGNAGQKCSAASLAIVVRSIYEDPSFLAQLSDAVESMSVGPSWDFATAIGPIIRVAESTLQRALHQLDPGESWLVEPKQLDEAGLQWRPGVKLGVQPGSWSHQHEWFGPVLGVLVAPDLDTAITWQNQTSFGLTAGIQSLSEEECEHWIETVEAGNLYVNRGITGAVVNRQPFGGWKRSSVGPTAKAGGLNYVNALRTWPQLTDSLTAIDTARRWWSEVGSLAIDRSGLSVERNFQRYCRPVKPVVVRVDASVSEPALSFIRFLVEVTGVDVSFSATTPDPRITVLRVESNEELVTRAESVGRIRWLSSEQPPIAELLRQGVSTDRRPLAQRGDIEMSRWLIEQSVAITNHRYGNIHGGPKPRCRGLGEAASNALPHRTGQ
jgi:RHH-type proline utilization regulon transcriptional repressor/proline dehydrogenase/delta 1-pyrroline-5-carboxylate dehydrogenase